MVEPEDRYKISITRPFLLTLVAAGFAIGVFVGAGMRLFTPIQTTKGGNEGENPESAFSFIRPPVQQKDAPGSRAGKELKPFRYKVNEAIQRLIKESDADLVSVYFRDLNTGNRFGIGERDKLLAADLLKIPLMMAYFKWSEASPVVLRKALLYTGDEGRSETLEPGKKYTVNDLLHRMIVSNDQAAYAILFANLPRPRLEKIFKELYVDYDPQRQDEYLSLSAYASFFRVLFNASYLSEEMSEKALRFLSRSASKTAMSSGLPAGIAFSGKRGEQTIRTSDDEEAAAQYRMHELGIIYHPSRPFLLGFVVQGKDRDQITKAIHDLTRLVYDEVDQQTQEGS
ncbi:MAG TPA: serine hydrolase [Nitrospirota bacterium]|nr:serine hydrolase [Nitrospirota bacterium]